MDVRPFPHAVARLGEYFTLTEPTGAGWRPIVEFFDAAVLLDLSEATRHAMARYAAADSALIPIRVAASSLHLAVASRLISPVIGGFATQAAVPVLGAEALRWRRTDHSVHFAADPLPWVNPANSAGAAEVVERSLLSELLHPLVVRLGAAAGLSPKVMWGNVMSAAHGAVTVMGLRNAALVPAGRELIRSLLERPLLRHTAAMTGSTFRRRSCCLFYRVPGGGLCGDCVLSVATSMQRGPG